MTHPNDVPSEMRRSGIDEDTLDRLLAGRVDPDDAPPGYAEVARVLGALAASGERDELAHEHRHVSLAAAALSRTPAASRPARRRSERMWTWKRRAKIGGLILVGATVGSTGLAAAGVLPDAAQDAFSAVLDRVGISVPASEDHPASTGADISQIATTTEATGVDKGAEISSAASGGISQAGEHGSGAASAEGAGEAPVSVPNAGGTGTADTASSGESSEGTVIADEASGGRSGSGSGNASVAPSTPSR